MKKTVCLIGRPNVGKSSIFNRILHDNKSIVMDIPGITRDRIYGTARHNDKYFYVIDTGGIDLGEGNFNQDIIMQAQFAIDEADLILFVVDGKKELNQNDFKIRDMLLKAKKNVIVVVNKIDNEKNKENIYSFYELGFENIIALSASHKIGIKELLNVITDNIHENENNEENILKFSFIGRPNVGKSSLINAVLNEDRSIVSDIAGTTRDSIDSRFNYMGNEYIVIDTAGMRKKGRIYEQVEKYSLLRSLRAIDRSDVCVLVIDAIEGIIEHDKHILQMAIDAGKAVVIAVNKWDAVSDPDKEMKKWKQLLQNEFQFAVYAKVVYLSALTKKRVQTLMPAVIEAYENANREIKTSAINKIIQDAYNLHNPPSYKGRRLKIYFVNQESAKPPKFIFNVNNKSLVHFGYERYLINKIRENFDFSGTPIILKFKNRGENDD